MTTQHIQNRLIKPIHFLQNWNQCRGVNTGCTKTFSNLTITKQTLQQPLRGTFAARQSNNFRGLTRGTKSLYVPNGRLLGQSNNMHTGHLFQNYGSILNNEFSRQNGNFRGRNNRFLWGRSQCNTDNYLATKTNTCEDIHPR